MPEITFIAPTGPLPGYQAEPVGAGPWSGAVVINDAFGLIKEYPGVGHSFMNEFGTPAPLQFIVNAAGFLYSEPEAEDAWRRILAFFGQHLT